MGFILRVVFLIVICLSTFADGMGQDDPFEINKYEFIDYEKNIIKQFNDTLYHSIFNELTNIGFQGNGKINIVHIGDSHLQADFLSGNFRKKLQTFFLGAKGGRGFVFPYKVAKTNNPVNYKVSSVGSWESCRNVEKTKNCSLGLSGISVSTSDTASYVSVYINDPDLPGYDFNKLMVFHEMGSENYKPHITSNYLTSVSKNEELGYTLFEFNKNIDRVKLSVNKTDSLQSQFVLHGFNFVSDAPGIVYHTIGVNGAQYESYLRCNYFTEHLKALNPNWVIVSLGTNDTYTNDFDSIQFNKDVKKVIMQIKEAAPNCAMLLTTPADHLYKKEYVNANVKIASRMIKNIAQLNGLSYWDFNYIMGGEGSINYWRYYGMAHTDFLHFTKLGYEYQSKLLFQAFLKAYDNYLTKHFLLEK